MQSIRIICWGGMEIDHLMWACADLDAGVEEIERLTGVRAELSGSHRGLGTRNALLSLGQTYLEIIAPDPNQDLEGNFGGRLAALNDTGLLSFAMTYRGLEELRAKLADKGVMVSGVQKTHRDTTEGLSLEWELLFVRSIPGAPFYIDWLECAHPATTSPVGCELLNLDVAVSDTGEFEKLTRKANLLSLKEDDSEKSVSLTAKLKTPNGIVKLVPLTETIALF